MVCFKQHHKEIDAFWNHASNHIIQQYGAEAEQIKDKKKKPSYFI